MNDEAAPTEDHASRSCRHYATVERAIAYIRHHAREQPSLEAIAAEVHLSPQHLQRVFSEWAGISPKRFLQHLTRGAVLQGLQARHDVLTVAADSGLSSGSRVHDLVVQCEAMTPGQVQSGGEGLDIGFGYGPTPFGEALIAWTSRGICHLEFLPGPRADSLAHAQARWPRARWSREDEQARRRLGPVFGLRPQRGAIHLLLHGTNFQLQVWTALLAVRPGQLVTYGELARRAGRPRAARAVGSALAANTIAALIPCHRVVRESGDIHHYRWGTERKIALIGWEASARWGSLDAPDPVGHETGRTAPPGTVQARGGARP